MFNAIKDECFKHHPLLRRQNIKLSYPKTVVARSRADDLFNT